MSLPRTFLKSIRFTRRCLWDGNDLNHHCTRGNGKIRDFCELSCNRNYYVFKEKLRNLSERDAKKKKPYLDQFVQYCMWKLIDRTPALLLDDQLKTVRSEKSIFIELIPSLLASEQIKNFDDGMTLLKFHDAKIDCIEIEVLQS